MESVVEQMPKTKKTIETLDDLFTEYARGETNFSEQEKLLLEQPCFMIAKSIYNDSKINGWAKKITEYLIILQDLEDKKTKHKSQF